MTPTRRTAVAAVALAAVGAGTALALAPAAGADEDLRLTTTATASTDLDLGVPGPGPGDTQVFLDEVRRDGRLVGGMTGSCTVALSTEERLVAACTATLLFDDGSSIATQGAGDEDPQVGPTEFRWAVTGGTGRYAGAEGEFVGTFVPGTDTVEVVVRLR
ncbi:allene oxide cyclase barrel-like domain-containing protein [Geodermatophilus sp. CPCC 206100]|uniref:allene oxide cyclase barrel-like domain-containing protein n=1 Tax=Geodermatophilus sp. CPCC 206100 TaxID=3020054 RepID=UPI003AFF88BC